MRATTDGAPAGALQGVLFDMDGLLVDTEPLWFEVERAVMARLGGCWTEADQRALVGGSLGRSVGYLLSRASRPAPADEVAQWLVGGMVALLAQRGAAPMPGAVELVAAVQEAGLGCALVTSSERPIMDAVLAGLAGLGVGFAATVCGADVANPKPHPEPYLRAAALLGADPSACVALEDSPNGVASAEAAGCATVAVPSLAPIGERPGRLVARSLADVDLDRLRALLRGGGRGPLAVAGEPVASALVRRSP